MVPIDQEREREREREKKKIKKREVCVCERAREKVRKRKISKNIEREVESEVDIYAAYLYSIVKPLYQLYSYSNSLGNPRRLGYMESIGYCLSGFSASKTVMQYNSLYVLSYLSIPIDHPLSCQYYGITSEPS